MIIFIKVELEDDTAILDAMTIASGIKSDIDDVNEAEVKDVSWELLDRDEVIATS